MSSVLDSGGKTNIGQLEEKCASLNSVVNSVLFAEVGGRSFSAKLMEHFFLVKRPSWDRETLD